MLLLALWIPLATAGNGDAPSEALRTVRIPLSDGRFQIGVLLGELADEIGLDGDAIAKRCRLNVSVNGVLGSTTGPFLDRLTAGAVSLTVDDSEVVLAIDRIATRRGRRGVHDAMRLLLESWFPDAAALAMARHDVFLIQSDNGVPTPLQGRGVPEAVRIADTDPPAELVLLVHGLDEPGLLWRDLIPVLHEAGHAVAEVRYPNDQAIPDSTRFFAEHLEAMRGQGVERVSIVAHSMGGLVARDLLTHPDYYAGDPTGADRFPEVRRLIMLGTPNHGSPLAFLRVGAEVRDQVVRSLSGDGLLIGGFFDGAGEAQDDLTPGSPFLTDLNDRPLPEGLAITIVAGSASPINGNGLTTLAQRLRENGPARAAQSLEGFAERIQCLVLGVGDGCVSIDSTRLEGVEDHVTVPGNHLTMVRNTILNRGDRIPPAIPIILERLGEDDR